MTTFLFDMDGTLFDTEKYYNFAVLGVPSRWNSFNAGLDRRWITWQSGNIAKN